jgi:ParB/RepB/Spo0J family partition protein
MAEAVKEKTEAPAGLQATYSALGGKKNNATLAMLDVKKLHIDEGFNPRQKPGDIDTLLSSIKKDGIINPLLVRPKGKSTTEFRLVCGSRRLACAKKLGMGQVPVAIRFDLEDDAEARAMALAENAEDARYNLGMMELANAYMKLKRAGWSAAQIAVTCATSVSRVNLTLGLLEAPKHIQARASGENALSMEAISEIGKADEATQKRVLPQIADSSVSATEVKRLIKEAAKDDGAVAATGRGPVKKKGSAREAALVVWREKRDISEMLVRLCGDYISVPKGSQDTFGFAAMAGAIAAILWYRGELDDCLPPLHDADDPKDKKRMAEFVRYVEAEAKKLKRVGATDDEVVGVEEGDEEAAEGEEGD